MIEIEIKGLQPSPQKFLLEKSGINLLEVNKFLKFCKTRVNSPTKNNKTPLNFLKIVEKPINFSNFSDPLFVPFQPTSTSENLSTKTLCNSSTSPFILPKKTQSLGIKQFSNPSSSTFSNSTNSSPSSKNLTFFTSPIISPKKPQPFVIRPFSNNSSSIFLNSTNTSPSSKNLTLLT